MRVAADPVHGAALFSELHRPGECRIRGAHHEQGFGLLTDNFRIWRGPLLCWLCTVPSAIQFDPGTGGTKALGFLHHGRMGRALDGELSRAGSAEFLRLTFLLGCGRSRLLPRYDPLSYLLVSAGASRAFHCARSE